MMAIRHFDVAVLGGGAAGCPVAWFLARAGLRVCVVEPGVAGGGGASSMTGGIVRAYDPDPALMQLSLRGVSLFAEWERHGLPGPSPLKRTGFHYLVAPENIEAAAAGAQWLEEKGYPVMRRLPASCLQELPFLRPDHPAPLALHEPMGGHGNARLTCQQLVRSLVDMGGTVLENAGSDIRLERAPHGWNIVLPHGTLRASIAVVAAGQATRDYLPQLPVFVRSIPLVRMQGATVTPLVDECNQTYFVPAGDGTFFCGSKCNTDLPHAAPVTDLPAVSRAMVEDARMRAAGVLHAGISPQPLGAIAGYDLYSANLRPQIGFAAEGLFTLAAFSGRGFKYCLAAGEAAANLVCEALGRTAPYAHACSLDAVAPQSCQPELEHA
ncbi:NAD(P)/FAD-dependent oxidoreductase [Noviherbaspirillum denitrificans]|nr:FAD-binding oxidoreductase [Noviherbaspirillum denitrificans]